MRAICQGPPTGLWSGVRAGGSHSGECMKTLIPLSLLLLAGAAQAQAVGACPQLPAETGLTWQHRAGPGFDFCSAQRADGSEAFTVYLGKDSPFTPRRGNREEQGLIDGREIYWYRGELVAEPDAQVRETLVQLGDGRVAHIWLKAGDDKALARALPLVQSLRFEANRISGR